MSGPPASDDLAASTEEPRQRVPYLRRLLQPPLPMIAAFIALVNVAVAWMAGSSLKLSLVIGAPIVVIGVLVLPWVVTRNYTTQELRVMTIFTLAWAALLVILALVVRPV